MSHPSEFLKTLDLIDGYVNDIGDEVQEKNSEELVQLTTEEGEEKPLTGHRCVSNDEIYNVAGHPDLRRMVVVYFFSISDTVAERIDMETATAVFNSSEVELEAETEEDVTQADIKMAASEELLARVPDEEQAAFENYVYMMVSSGDHSTRIYSESGGVTGFNTASRIFPYERDFGIKDFYETVGSVLEAGIRGKRLIGRTVSINKNEEDPAKTQIQFNYGW